MTDRITKSAEFVRVFPFALFVAFTFFQDAAGETGRYWIYLLKTVAAAGAVLAVRRHVAELEFNFSLPAIGVGIAIFALWVGIDGLYPSAGEIYAAYLCPSLHKIGLAKSCAGAAASAPWNPQVAFGRGSALSLFFIVVRIAGASLVVPVVEEIFWRSFVYRFIAHLPFDRESLGRFVLRALLLTSLFFGLEHREWLAGILCGLAFQGLVLWKKRLGDAIVAHAITNLLLGVWVVWRGAWRFW